MELVPQRRHLPIWQLASVILANAVVTTWCNVWFFRYSVLRPIESHSMGLITPTLLANGLLILAILVALLRFGFGLRFCEMGLCARKFRLSLKVVIVLFLSAQLLCLLLQFVNCGKFELRNDLSVAWFLACIGELIGQLFGNAFFEEVFFRGVLFTQLIRLFGASATSSSGSTLGSSKHSTAEYPNCSWKAVWLAAISSGSIFALQHLPNRLMAGTSVGKLVVEMAGLTVAGVFFAFIYRRTGNIWTSIAFHAMANSLFYLWYAASWVHPLTMAILGFWLLLQKPVS